MDSKTEAIISLATALAVVVVWLAMFLITRFRKLNNKLMFIDDSLHKPKKPFKRKSDPYYHSAAWKKLRDAFLRLNPLCCVCGAKATVADHVRQRIAGGADSFENLSALCWPCHQKRSASQGGKAVTDKRKHGNS